MTSPQVLVVGSGLSGLILALSLQKNGIPTRIIEKSADSKIGERGAGLMPRILEIEHFLGLDNDVLQESIDWPTVNAYAPTDPYHPAKIIPIADHHEPTPAFPVMKGCTLGQEQHQDIIRRHLEQHGCYVEHASTLTKLDQNETSVTVEMTKIVDGGETKESAQFAYVIGADGAHSFVRRALGIQFIGETRAMSTILCDAEIEGVGEGNAMRVWGEQSKAVVSVRNTCKPRIYQVMFGGPETDIVALNGYDAEVATKHLQNVTQRKDMKITKIIRCGEWRPNIRLADKFRVGRVFIVGDAAHAHPPAGGQGLNTSIQDSFNLAWKLSLVLKGRSLPQLLDSYQLERMPVVARMLNMTAQLFDAVIKKVVDHENALSERKELAITEKSWRRGREIFQLDIHYRWSDIVFDERYEQIEDGGDPYGVPGREARAGDRAPDAPDLKSGETQTRLFDLLTPTTHTVLVFVSPDSVGGVVSALAPLRDANAKLIESNLVRVVYVFMKDIGREIVENVSSGDVNQGFVDASGHAFAGYGIDPKSSTPTIVIVRPDGMIGAFAKSAKGVEKYIATVFSS